MSSSCCSTNARDNDQTRPAAMPPPAGNLLNPRSDDLAGCPVMTGRQVAITGGVRGPSAAPSVRRVLAAGKHDVLRHLLPTGSALGFGAFLPDEVLKR